MANKKRTNLSKAGPGGPSDAVFETSAPEAPGVGGESPAPFAALLSGRRREMKLTLQRVADMVGCAKSYLWMLETGARTGPPADELVRKLQHALGFKADELIRAARWQQTPSDVRRAVTEMAGKQHLARRLGEIFKGEAVGSDGTLRGRLDEAYRSGELRALVERLAPSEPEMEKPFWPPAPVLQVPLINKVAAGYPREFTDLGYPARSAAEYVHTPDLTDPDAFACRVVGDSMLPDYREGDVVVFPMR